MRKMRLFLSAMFLIAAGFIGSAIAAPEAAVKTALSVSALPGNCRVYPIGDASPDVSGEVLQALGVKNNVWDSKEKIVRITSARRETVSFQLILKKTGAEITDINIKVSELKSAAGVLPSGSIRLFLAGYVEEEGKFYPDILVPFSAGGVVPFSIPHKIERLALVSGQENQSVWADVEVSKKTEPGLYKGTVTVTANAGGNKITETLPLELTVINLALPAERSGVIVLDTYGDIVKTLKLQKDQKVMLDAEKRFYRLARDNRMFIHAIPFPQSGRARKEYMPDFTRDASGKLKADWTRFDNRYGAYLDGTAFDDGTPIEHFPMYFNLYWPAESWPKAEFPDPANRSEEKLKYEAAWLEHAKAYIEHFKEKKWTKTTFLVKMNHYKKSGQDFPLLWNMDLSRTKEDFQAVAYYANLAHRAFKESKPLDIKFRFDPGHSYCSETGCDFKEWDINKAGDLTAETDFWFFEWEHGVAHLPRLKELKNKGKGVYVYNHGWTPVENASKFRGLGLVMQAAGLDGYCAYNVPHQDLKKRREGEWNNYIMYVGWDGKSIDAFPSIRMKLQRDGMADYEYIKLARVKDSVKTDEIIAGMVKFGPLPKNEEGLTFTGPILSVNPTAYGEARKALIGIAGK